MGRRSKAKAKAERASAPGSRSDGGSRASGAAGAPAAADATPPRWAGGAALALVLLATALTYASSVHPGFAFDDRNFQFSKGSFTWALLGRLFEQSAWGSGGTTGFTYRPLAMITIHLDGNFWGADATGYHLTSLWLHVLATGLVFGFLLRVLRDLAARKTGGWSERSSIVAATAAALLFGVHPIHSEAIDSFFNRSELLVTAAATGALWILWVWRARRPIAAWAAAAVLYMAALLSKESAVMIPALLVIVVGVLQLEGPLRSRVRPLLPVFWLLLPLAYYFALRQPALAHQPLHGTGTVATTSMKEGVLHRVAIGFTTLADHARMLIWPYPLRAAYDKGFLRMPVVVAVAILAALVWFAIRSYRSGRPEWTAGIAFFYAGLAPATLQAFVAERFVYLPSLGIALALAIALARWPERWRSSALMATGVVCAVCAAITWQRAYEWRDDVTLFRAETRRVSDSPEEWAQLIATLVRVGSPKDAAPVCDQVAERLSGANLAHVCAGVAHELAQVRAAESRYKRAIAQDAGPSAHVNYARLLVSTRRKPQAEEQFRMALEEEKNPLQRRLIEADMKYRLHDDVDGAVREMTQLLVEDPQFVTARALREAILRSASKMKTP